MTFLIEKKAGNINVLGYNGLLHLNHLGGDD
jgi:hypothetical protein